MSESFNSRQSGLLNATPQQIGSFTNELGVSFGRLQGGTSFGGERANSFMQNYTGFLVSQDQYRSSLGFEDAAQMQFYDFAGEPPKSLLFRSSGDQFEMQFEDARLERLVGPLKIEEEMQQKANRSFGSSSGISKSREQSGSMDPEVKLESGELISSKFKPEVKSPNQNIMNDNKSLFNVNQAKSIYTNKISQLVEQVQTKLTLTPKLSPRLSKSQQKLQRKSSNNQRDVSDQSSNDQLQSSPQISGQEQGGDPVQQKLAKNRESARNSRARKKIYYELLETKVNELQDEVDRLRDTCKNYSKSMDIQNKSQEKFQLFLDQQQQLFDKLETCIVKGRDNSEVGIILDALRYRTNSNSQERNDAGRAYFDQIVEVQLPIQTKYLLYALERGKDFFATSPDDYTEWMKEPFKKTDIKPEQVVKVKRMKTKLQGVKSNISESIQKIKDQIKNIQSEAGKVDLMWEQLKECLTPTQLGTCILAMRQNSYRSELQTQTLFTNLKNSNMSEEDEQFNFNVEEQNPSITPRKQVKKSQ